MYHVYIIICEQVAIWENMVSVYIKLHGISLRSVDSHSQSEYVWYILYGDVRFVAMCSAIELTYFKIPKLKRP